MSSIPERLYREHSKRYERLPNGFYGQIHRLMPLVCVDGYIKLKNGVLLVKRKEEPAKGLWWPLGGRRPRGLKREEAMKKIAKRETGLDVEILAELGTEDTMFDTDPEWLNQGQGTDTTNTVYALKLLDSSQEVKLDKTISGSRIITTEEYNQEKRSFHWYVDKYLPIVLSL